MVPSAINSFYSTEKPTDGAFPKCTKLSKTYISETNIPLDNTFILTTLYSIIL